MEKSLDIDIVLPSKYQMAIKGKEEDFKGLEAYIKSNSFESLKDIAMAFKHFNIKLVELKKNSSLIEIGNLKINEIKS